MAKREKTLSLVLQRLSKNNGVTIKSNSIECSNTSGKVGNGTLGDIDYLIKVHKYNAVFGAQF